MEPDSGRHAAAAALLGIVVSLTSPPLHAESLAPPENAALALEILKRSVAYRTFPGEDQVPEYAAYLAGVLRAGGFSAGDITITPFGDTATLMARYRGTDPRRKPIVIAAHMDVVPALMQHWQRDPFTATVENGFVYGRGVYDNKFGIATTIATLLRLKAEGFKPTRDILLALTGDEETTQASTARLAQQLRDAELVLNSDGGVGILDADGKPLVYAIQAAEKTYADFEIEFTSPGGHSSAPTRDNAINSLGRAIERIAEYRFPRQDSELTREFFRVTGSMTPGELGRAMRRYAEDPDDERAIEVLSSRPEYVGQLGTTCIATMLRAGHAPNALPQSAILTVNCRIFPGVPVREVQDTLIRVVDDPAARITILGNPVASEASPLRADVMAALRKAVDLRHPGLPIVPQMSSGATDSLYYRNLGVPSYGVAGIFIKASDDFTHGLNERVPVETIDGALAQWYSLLKDLAR